MPSAKFDFSDINHGSGSVLDGGDKQQKRGCWVSPLGALGIVLAAAVVATFVGLMVGYLHPNSKTESPDVGTTTPLTTAIPLPTTDAPATNYRLPTDLKPYHYNLRLRPHIYSNNESHFSFEGHVEVHVTASAATREIVLNAKILTVTPGTIAVRRVADHFALSVAATEVDTEREFFIIRLVDDLEVGQNYTAAMEFQGPLKPDLTGLYYSSYTASDGQKRYLATTQFSSTEARKAFPCYDEPYLKAVFNTTLERRAGMTSYSNMNIRSSEPLQDGWIADEYHSTLPMSTFVLGFIVSDFGCVNATYQDSPIFICTRPTALGQVAYAQEIVGPMQKFFEWYHQEPYPLPKMIHTSVPDFPYGAMENWGLIIYRETSLLYDPISASAANRQRVASVVAHELSHQWFGNLVTPAWWDDVWLKEGFASYMEIVCTEQYYNDTWMMDSQMVVDDLQVVFGMDSLASSHPVYQEVNNPAEIRTMFDGITYSKGASVIRMMRYFLGDEIFRWGLAEYLKVKKYTAANHTEMFNFLTQKAKEHDLDLDVSEIMNTWIRQMGYPVVTYSYESVTGVLTLSQKHFFLDPSAPNSQNIWQVPISWVDDSSTDADWMVQNVTWLTADTGQLTAKANAKWIIGNPHERFYYRVNYNNGTWNALIDQLQTTHSMIKPTSRVQLIDDSFNLGRAGIIDQLVAMRVSLYLDSEQDYTPWVAAKRNLGYLGRMFQLSGSTYYLQIYVQSKVDSIYRQVGWNESDEEPHLIQRLRVVVLNTACGYGTPECTQQSADLYRTWRNNVHNSGQNATNPINNNLRGVVYCSAIAAGGADEWNFGFEQYILANSGGERSTLMDALACTGQVYILAEYLNRALAEQDIQRQDFRTVIVEVARNPAGRALAWDFLRQNWNIVFDWFGAALFTLSGIVSGVTENFSTEWELGELEAFMELQASQNKLGSASRAFEQAIDKATANIQWRATNEQKVAEWIRHEVGL